MAEDEDSLEAEIVYPITCGDSKANLIWRKFVCPGINVKCVQVRIKTPPVLGSCLPMPALWAHLACPGFDELLCIRTTSWWERRKFSWDCGT